MGFANIRLEVRDGVGYLTLNRPEAANTITLDLARELMQAAIALSEDRRVRAVLLAAEGKMFSAGGDLRNFSEQGERLPAYIKEVTANFHSAVVRLTTLDAPVVAAVTGMAAGIGLALVLAADLVVAARSARFTMAYTKAGLAPDGGSTWFLPRLVGWRRAMELTLTNRLLTAEEALDWGIVNRVVDDATCRAEAEAWARELAQGAPIAAGRSKRLLALSGCLGLEAQLDLESRAISEAAGTPEGREGLAAFLAKRTPVFPDRDR